MFCHPFEKQMDQPWYLAQHMCGCRCHWWTIPNLVFPAYQVFTLFPFFFWFVLCCLHCSHVCFYFLVVSESQPKEVMWGCDLTPLYDEVGSRLMSFTAFLPMGMQLTSFPRPSDLPGDADLVMVEEVESKGEADVIGIQAGDILRAVSYVGTGPEPGWLDKMLGAEAMPMKKVPGWGISQRDFWWIDVNCELMSSEDFGSTWWDRRVWNPVESLHPQHFAMTYLFPLTGHEMRWPIYRWGNLLEKSWTNFECVRLWKNQFQLNRMISPAGDHVPPVQVTDALQSNRDSPDGRLVLLLERPQWSSNLGLVEMNQLESTWINCKSSVHL